MSDVGAWADRVRRSVGATFFGKDQVIDMALVALLCRGHVLIEDVPGVGKTVLARALAKSIGGVFKQIQCTPDLLPADVLGVSIYNPRTGAFDFRQGPIMANFVVVDEINRATPRTQSALLEAMAEGQVSVEGRSTALPSPFFLIATESPTDSEGTFPLPEVQKDRFFLTVSIGYPDADAERRIMLLERRERHPLDEVQAVSTVEEVRAAQEAVVRIHVESSLRTYILRLINATRSDRRLTIGVSPRGSLAVYQGSQALAAIRGRDYVVPEDIREVIGPVLRKRLIIRSEVAGKGLTEATAIAELLNSVGVPPLEDAVS